VDGLEAGPKGKAGLEGHQVVGGEGKITPGVEGVDETILEATGEGGAFRVVGVTGDAGDSGAEPLGKLQTQGAETLEKLQTPGVELAANQQWEPAAVEVQLAPGKETTATQQRGQEAAVAQLGQGSGTFAAQHQDLEAAVVQPGQG